MANKSNGYYLQLRNAMHRCMKPVNRKLNMTSNGQYLCEQVWIRLRQYENGKIKMGEALFHNGGGRRGFRELVRGMRDRKRVNERLIQRAREREKQKGR